MSIVSKLRGLREIWAFDNRLFLILSKLFYPNEQLLVYRYKGLEILMDHSGGDANGAREVLVSPMYRRFLSRMHFDGPANVLDLGANNGGFPLLLHAAGIRLKKVVSVEFNPQTFARLHFNLTRNLPCAATPVNAAVCGERRVIETTLGKGSVSDNIYNPAADRGTAYSIAGMTLDDLCRDHFDDEIIDICKIDIEEAEFEVFLGGEHQAISRCRYVVMEIHERGGRKADELIPVLEKLGLERQNTDPDADPSVHFFVNKRYDRRQAPEASLRAKARGPDGYR
ncbi:MAG: FkbM family methyltransferase [Acidobacteria bacterium]|nr:FkbM family methyltransferase [Acidobacteriota bacterium]